MGSKDNIHNIFKAVVPDDWQNPELISLAAST